MFIQEKQIDYNNKYENVNYDKIVKAVPQVAVSQVAVPQVAVPQVAPTYIGIGLIIGEGTYKTVYSCVETHEVNNTIFTLPNDATIDKLVIAVININVLVKNSLNDSDKTIFETYIVNPQNYNRSNKAQIEKLINYKIQTIDEEIKLQNLFFLNQLAPKIYEHRFDKDKNMFYILEEKCGSPLVTYITINQTEDNFNKIVELIKKIADTGYINVDIKPANTCTKIADDGSLSEIIALDFDTNFFIKFDLTNEEIKEQGKIFMLTLFIAYLGKYKKIFFEKLIVENHLNYAKIKDMLTFFAGNPKICAKEMHPILMLYHYIIKQTAKSMCSLQTPEKIDNLTTKICSFIFPKKGGSIKSKRSKKSRRSNKSKRSRK